MAEGDWGKDIFSDPRVAELEAERDSLQERGNRLAEAVELLTADKRTFERGEPMVTRTVLFRPGEIDAARKALAAWRPPKTGDGSG